MRTIIRPQNRINEAACLIYEDELTAHRCFRFGNNLLRESSAHIELRQSSYQHIDRLKLKKMPAAARTHFDVAGKPSRNLVIQFIIQIGGELFLGLVASHILFLNAASPSITDSSPD
jgi:hypothetical protein